VEKENDVVLRGEIEDTRGVVPLPGARELLGSLTEDKWALVTSCARPLAEVRLKAARLPMPRRMITCEDVRKGKPDPEPYAKGAALLGIPAQDCAVFEDAPAGIRAGKAAGATVIAFTTTAPESELVEARADFILSGFLEVSVLSPNGSGLIRLRVTRSK
jgi:sugar-phosphatase